MLIDECMRYHANILCFMIEITCDALPVVTNGTIISTGHHYNDTAWLQCDPGHRTLYGFTDVWMICQADGTWNVGMEQWSCGGKYSKCPYFNSLMLSTIAEVLAWTRYIRPDEPTHRPNSTFARLVITVF